MSPEEMLFYRLRDEEPAPAGYDKMLRYARQQRKPIEPMAFTGSSGFPEPIVRGAEKTLRGVAANVEPYIRGQILADPTGAQAMVQDRLRQKEGDTEYARLMGGGELAPVPEPRKPPEISQGPFAEEQSLKTVPGMLSSFVSPENLIPLGGRAIGAVRQAAKDLGRGATRMGHGIADRLMVPSPGDAGVLKGGVLAAGGAGAAGYSEDSESMMPGGRPSMLALEAARQRMELKLIREAERASPSARFGVAGRDTSLLDPQEAGAAAEAAKRRINLGALMDKPLVPVSTEGYKLFDYSKLGPLGESDEVFQAGRKRPQPAQGKFERLPDELRRLVADPYVYQNMEKAMLRGEPLKNWYDVRQFTQALMDAGLTREQAAKYMEFQQASAQNLGPELQSRVANYLWHKHTRGELPPDAKMSFPKGYGSKTQKGIWSNAVDISNDLPIESEKLFSYGQNYLGNWGQATVDTHAMRLPSMLSHNPNMLETGLTQGDNPTLRNWLHKRDIPYTERIVKEGKQPSQLTWSPQHAYENRILTLDEAAKQPTWWRADPAEPASAYGALEQYLYEPLAQKLGITPAQGQAAAWVGGGPITGLQAEPKFMLQKLEDMVMRLSKQHGMPPAQVIRELSKGNIY